MSFRIAACIVALLAFAILLDEIWGLKHSAIQQNLELQRRVSALEEVPEQAPPICLPKPGVWREWYDYYDTELDQKDFKKRKF